MDSRDCGLSELIARYQGIALGYLTSKVGPDAAQDLYQGAVEAILAAGKTFSSLDHLRNYFFVALRNAAADHGRRQSRSRQVPLPEDPAALADPREEGPEARWIAAEEAECARRRVDALRAALSALPEAERRLVEERFSEGKTFREISESTGTPISTLKSREDAILQKLRQLIGKDPARA